MAPKPKGGIAEQREQVEHALSALAQMADKVRCAAIAPALLGT